MSYISEIFNRADLQQIREFLLHGAECPEIDRAPYKQRLEEAEKAALKMINTKFPDRSEYEPITGELYKALGVFRDVYMEIGLQAGVMLAVQLLSGDRRGGNGSL